MPLVFVQILLALSIVLTVIAGLWLMINARSLARLFRKADYIEPGPNTGVRPQLHSKGKVLAVFVAFNIGWMAAVVIWSWAITEEASDLVEARAT